MQLSVHAACPQYISITSPQVCPIPFSPNPLKTKLNVHLIRRDHDVLYSIMQQQRHAHFQEGMCVCVYIYIYLRKDHVSPPAVRGTQDQGQVTRRGSDGQLDGQTHGGWRNGEMEHDGARKRGERDTLRERTRG